VGRGPLSSRGGEPRVFSEKRFYLLYQALGEVMAPAKWNLEPRVTLFSGAIGVQIEGEGGAGHLSKRVLFPWGQKGEERKGQGCSSKVLSGWQIFSGQGRSVVEKDFS